MSTPTPEQIEADIERQRAQLAQTVDQLGHKLDVKEQARLRASRVKDRATTENGAPRPEVVAAATAVVALIALLVWRRKRS